MRRCREVKLRAAFMLPKSGSTPLESFAHAWASKSSSLSSGSKGEVASSGSGKLFNPGIRGAPCRTTCR